MSGSFIYSQLTCLSGYDDNGDLILQDTAQLHC